MNIVDRFYNRKVNANRKVRGQIGYTDPSPQDEGGDVNFGGLEFKRSTKGPGGIYASKEFPNGYGVSVVQSNFSYGGDEGLYEIAILLNGRITYDSPLHQQLEDAGEPKDVFGWLSEDEVVQMLNTFASFPPVKNDKQV